MDSPPMANERQMVSMQIALRYVRNGVTYNKALSWVHAEAKQCADSTAFCRRPWLTCTQHFCLFS